MNRPIKAQQHHHVGRGPFPVLTALVEFAVLQDGGHDADQGLHKSHRVDGLLGGFALGQRVGVDVGHEAFQPQGKHTDGGKEGGDHDDVHQVVVDEMGLPDFVALGDEVQPVDAEHLQDQADHDENHRRDGQQDRAVSWGRPPSWPPPWGWRIPERHRPARPPARPPACAAGAQGGAVAAVVAQPDVGLPTSLSLSPQGGDHLLAGKGFGVGRNGAGHRAGGALIALFQVLAPEPNDSLINPRSGSTTICFRHF
jgi:hypothetical protein